MKNGLLRISPAGIEDLSFARELVFSNMRPYYLAHGMAWSDASFQRGWESNNGFIAWVGDARVGYFSIRCEPGFLYLNDMQVLSEYRSQGIGGAMMRFIMDELLDDEGRAIRLKVFNENPAIRFYEKSGFSLAFSDHRFSGMEYRSAKATR